MGIQKIQNGYTKNPWIIAKRAYEKSTIRFYKSYSGSFNLFHPLEYPPSSINIYLKLLSQIVFLWYFILISHWILPLSRIWIFSFYLVSHWILPLSLNLYSNILFNVPLDFTSFIKLNIVFYVCPIGLYLSFVNIVSVLKYSFWWSVPLSLNFIFK